MKSTTKIIVLVVLYCLGCVYSQQVGTNQAEVHPPIGTYYCTKNGCAQQAKSIVLDANWRWTHKVGGSDNCYTGDMWDKTACPDGVTCAKNCAIDGADYPGTYGIVASGNSVTLKFVTHGPYSTNIGSRVYLLRDDNNYEMFQLLGKEFTFDVDVSNLPCGLNGALYFVEMSQDGGKGKFPGNVAGAKYGTGYCDAQCPHDLKWINGEANCEDWQPAPDDPNSGIGKYGTCCSEMDIWEANKISEAYTAHPCTVQGQTRCMGTQCGDGDNRYGGVCDKDGCDFNAYRLGVKDYYGPSNTIDTTKKITVVTQFITKDGTANTDLSEIRRIWVQDGKVMANAATKIPNVRGYNTITDQFCSDVKTVFGDKNDFATKGGLRGFGGSLKRGVVLVMSLWDDHAAHMLWLDSNYPTSADPSKPGIARGTCSTSSGVPDDVQNQYPNSSVTFSNIKSGDLNTTFSAKW